MFKNDGRFVSKTLAKIRRAGKHIGDLQVALDAFFESNPYKVEGNTDPNKLERTYRLVSMRDVPDEIITIVGDAIQNLRSCRGQVKSS